MPWKRIVVAVVLLLVVSLAALLFWPSDAPMRTLPTPNGYGALIEAAQQLTEPPDYNEATIEELRDYVSVNSNALAAIKAALEMECMVPTEFGSQDYFSIHVPRLMAAKQAVRAIALKGKLAELEMRYDEAAMIYLNAIHLGQNVTRNGFAIDMLTGIVCEAVGAAPMEILIPTLTAETCSEIARRLEVLENKREPLEYIKSNEYRFMRSQPDWGSKVTYFEELIVSAIRPINTTINTTLGKSWPRYSNRINKTKLLTTRLAARSYELEHGTKPQSFNDLIPKYLQAVPTDSKTGTNLVYNFAN